MVEMMKKKVYILAATLSVAGAVLAQHPDAMPPRIAGLENNTEYISLLQEESQLQIREDSIVDATAALRRQLRGNPENRQRYSQEILQLESSIFDIRNSRGRIVSRINAIEQDWVLSNLNSPETPAAAHAAEKSAAAADIRPQVRYLTDNIYFRDALPEADYNALLKAQAQEFSAVDYVNLYFSNYRLAAEAAAAYETAPTEAEAVDLYDKLMALKSVNGVLADSLSHTWNYIFDNKSYAYGYLLDARGKEDILVRQEQKLSDAARELSALRGTVESEAVTDYFLRKNVLLDYETALAEELRLTAASDSLKGVARQLEAIDFRLPRIDVELRAFIQYDSVGISSVPRYTTQNPIPECRVYERGTIYRVQLGTFSAKRPASVFRGIYPLCYQNDAEGRWIYYAGAFATRAGAEAAQKALKTRGFAHSEIVVWNDGVYRNLTRDDAAPKVWRIEITGVESLSAAVREAIAATAEAGISRVKPQVFIVGTFDDKALADRVAAAVVQVEPGIAIKVEEIIK